MPWTTDDDVKKHKKGLTPKQMAQWRRIANAVLKKCMARGGTEKECAASAIKQANGVVNANVSTSSKYSVYKIKQTIDYEPKLTVHQDKAHLVIPVVMMVEGVHNGSQGPLLHTIDQLGKFPASWDGRPVVIYHPEIDGIPVSANSPEIIDTRTVGRVYNTSVDGKKLRAEVWLDEDKLNSISADTLEMVNNSQSVEVSLGMFTENEMVKGDYEGEEYDGIAYNHRPDHLAILPDQIGACSCEDGCGLGANQNNEDMDIKKLLTQEKIKDTVMSFNKEGMRLSTIGNNAEVGYREKMDAVYTALRGLDKEGSYHYLEEMYEDELIYNKSSNDGTTMYKQSYKFESGKIEFVGEPIEVHKKVEYVLNNNVEFKKEDKMLKGKECPDCVKKINDLIANKDSGFVEADREWMETLEASALDKIAPKVIEKEKIVEKTVEVNKLTPAQEADLAFLAKQRAEAKTKMIQGIQANTSKEIWPDAVLAAMSEDVLKRLSDSVAKKEEEVVDYSFMPGFNANVAGEVEPLLPGGIKLETAK